MNEQLKPYKTVEEIAKKHRMEISDIQRQLDMGVPIEHEHTKNHKLAMEIALQHLDEIPDYYTRLKKLEADAKKHHKKFKDVKEALDGKSAKNPDYSLKDWFNDEWVQTGGKYDGKPCAKQPGQKTKPYCRDPDDRAAMSKEERNKRAAKKRKEDPNPNRSGEAKMVTQESAGKKDACYKKVKSRYDVWPSAYASGALVKCRKVGAANWGTKTEETQMIRYCPKCKKDETQSECKYGPKFWGMYSTPSMLTTNQLKYDIAQVHPANESKEPDHEYSMARSELSTIISAAKRLRGKLNGEGNIEAWVQSKITKAADYIDAAADYLDSGEHEVKEACWKGYKQVGMKKKGKKIVPNCVEESVSIEDANGNPYVEFIDIMKPEPLKATKGIGSRILGEGKTFGNFMLEASAAWQRKEGKNPEGGLNAAGVASYRRENPGSKLQTAVTTKPSKLKPGSKDAKRRKSFCARMSGMPGPTKDEKGRPTRKTLSLRKWNCN